MKAVKNGRACLSSCDKPGFHKKLFSVEGLPNLLYLQRLNFEEGYDNLL